MIYFPFKFKLLRIPKVGFFNFFIVSLGPRGKVSTAVTFKGIICPELN